MEIKGKDILVLGGWGLVGIAICRKLLGYHPRSITISSLTREQAESACAELKTEANSVKLTPAWGNIFVRSELKDLPRTEILDNPEHRLTLARDILERTTVTEFNRFFLYDLVTRAKPHIVIDCVNSATGLAYQDIYSAGLRVLKGAMDARSGKQPDDLLPEVEKLLGSLYLPQLVRHVQVIYQAMKDAGTRTYIKIGTSGTGGMGLNIPYTHSEDKPSRVLLSKSCIAGAHSLMLFLMARTPDAPYTKEIKPATAIAWKRIEYGEVLRDGQPIPLYDCPIPVEVKGEFPTRHEDCRKLGENLKGVFIDTGENGTFSLGEFSAITTHEQMEYITPEEIAQTVVWEIEGGTSGHDVVAALDASVLGPTYRAGFMRSLAIRKMNELVASVGDNPVAFELLGPPRLAKLLYEAHILKRTVGTINATLTSPPADLARRAAELVTGDARLRSRIISIGIPILLPDGVKLLRGPTVKVPGDPRQTNFPVTSQNLENWCRTGWVDLREVNMKHWQERLRILMTEAAAVGADNTSSRFLRNTHFWRPDEPLDEGELVGWIFITEDQGRRMK
jgi:hypothetical protein